MSPFCTAPSSRTRLGSVDINSAFSRRQVPRQTRLSNQNWQLLHLRHQYKSRRWGCSLVVEHLLACWEPGVNHKHGRKKETFRIYLSSTLEGKQVGLLCVCHNRAEEATWESTDHGMERFWQNTHNETGVVAEVSAFKRWRQKEQKFQGHPCLDARLKASPGYTKLCLKTNKKPVGEIIYLTFALK